METQTERSGQYNTSHYFRNDIQTLFTKISSLTSKVEEAKFTDILSLVRRTSISSHRLMSRVDTEFPKLQSDIRTGMTQIQADLQTCEEVTDSRHQILENLFLSMSKEIQNLVPLADLDLEGTAALILKTVKADLAEGLQSVLEGQLGQEDLALLRVNLGQDLGQTFKHFLTNNFTMLLDDHTTRLQNIFKSALFQDLTRVQSWMRLQFSKVQVCT